MNALPENVLSFEKPSASVVMVDPDTARRWLGRNLSNRNIRNRVVMLYARDMSSGRWHLTGEAIKFAKDGRLLDGQHRLQAVIESGCTVAMFVVRGLDDDSQSVMDTGSKRLTSDQLHLKGAPNAALLAASARWAFYYEAGWLHIDNTARVVSTAELLDFVEDNPDLHDAVAFGNSVRKRIEAVPSVLVCAIWMTSRVDPEQSARFWLSLADLTDLPSGSPVLALSSRLREVARTRQRVDNAALLSLLIRAWNHWRKGTSVASIPIYRGGKVIRCPDPR